MRKKKYSPILTRLPLLLLPLLMSGCSSALMDPQGPVGEAQKSLIITAFLLMMIVVIPVIVMTIVFGWRYRATNLAAKYTPDWAHSNKIEIVVWLIPCVIILFLAIMTWQTSHSLAPQKPLGTKAETLEIQVVSLDWKWLFIYPEQDIATVNEVAIPVDVPVHFHVSSGSVMNSFFIPALGSQIYAMAGMDNDVHLIADEEGVYPVTIDGACACASACGSASCVLASGALDTACPAPGAATASAMAARPVAIIVHPPTPRKSRPRHPRECRRYADRRSCRCRL